MTNQPDHDIIALGLSAQSVLGDEAFLAAVEMARAQVVQRWSEAQTVEERERCHAEYMAIPALVVQLRTLYDRGQAELAEENEPQ